MRIFANNVRNSTFYSYDLTSTLVVLFWALGAVMYMTVWPHTQFQEVTLYNTTVTYGSISMFLSLSMFLLTLRYIYHSQLLTVVSVVLRLLLWVTIVMTLYPKVASVIYPFTPIRSVYSVLILMEFIYLLKLIGVIRKDTDQ
jgi:hypothetical protein